MSAGEHLEPRQFGNLVIERDHRQPVPTVTATTPSGRNAGYLMWERPGEHNGNRHTITAVKVSSQFRRKGVATAMLEHARQYAPDLQHSHALLDDGEAWANARPL